MRPRRPLPLLGLLGLLAAAACRPIADPIQSARPLTLVVLGASDSVGIGARAPETEGWVPVLYGRLPPGSSLVNLGVSGALIDQALDQQLPVAVDADPDLVAIWLVANDFNAGVPLERYSASLDALISRLREQTRAAIFVGNLPDLSRTPAFRDRDPVAVRNRVLGWNDRIRGIVEQHDATLVDLHAAWQSHGQDGSYVASDGFHPSTLGHQRLAETFFEAMRPAFAGPI